MLEDVVLLKTYGNSDLTGGGKIKPSNMTPEQIRRRLNDYDELIRQGLEDGTIRGVIKQLQHLLQDLLACHRGTPEQQAAFPRSLFMYNFIRAWNNAELRHSPDFIDQQLEAMESFDRCHPTTIATSPIPFPSLSPSPVSTTPPSALVQRQQVRDIERPKRIVEVVMPLPRKFRQIEDKKEVEEGGKKGDKEEDEEGSPTRGRHATGGGRSQTTAGKLNDPPCKNCQRVNKKCLRNPTGGACLNCKRGKTRCGYASKTGMKRRRDASEVEQDEEESADEERLRKPKPKRVRTQTYANLDIEARFSDAQIAELTESARQLKQMSAQLGAMETNVHRLTGVLEGFFDPEPCRR